MLDGRIARLSKTGTKFGAELDSLVDVISFGIAPALVVYFLEFANAGKFGWAVCYLYVVATALRLARYNVSSHDKPQGSWFTGLPSPAAGMTLAAYYPFSQTQWYRASTSFLDLQHEGLTVLVLLAGALMVSNIKYPRWPRIGFRSASGIAGLLVHVVILSGAIIAPSSFLFPLGLTYMAIGIIRSSVLSLLDRGQTIPPSPDASAGSSPEVHQLDLRRRRREER
jgi:CDP-diacylglycerol--serine O-phosphatidyltransferase